MPASEVDHRGHEAALLPRNAAAESFVSFIPLFGGKVIYRSFGVSPVCFAMRAGIRDPSSSPS